MVHQALVVRVVWVQLDLQDRVVPLVVEQLALQVHQDHQVLADLLEQMRD